MIDDMYTTLDARIYAGRLICTSYFKAFLHRHCKFTLSEAFAFNMGAVINIVVAYVKRKPNDTKSFGSGVVGNQLHQCFMWELYYSSIF